MVWYSIKPGSGWKAGGGLKSNLRPQGPKVSGVVKSRRSFLAGIGLAAFQAACVRPTGVAVRSLRKDSILTFVHNEAATGADVDVVDAQGRPQFRVLIPEAVTAENAPVESFLNHTTPGQWGYAGDVHWGVVTNPDWVEVRVALRARTAGILAVLCVKNLSKQVLDGVQIDVCVSVSHLPSPHGNWINPRFLDVSPPFDRDEAGRFWYERVAPTKLKAYADGQWKPAHVHPDSPSSEGIPPYRPFRYLDAPAAIMAVESLDGGERLFQAWDVPCDVRCAFPGNSCMHLLPHVAERLAPGEDACIAGEIAITKAPWDRISRWKGRWNRHEYEAMTETLDRPYRE